MNIQEEIIIRSVAKALIEAGHKISVDFERGYDTQLNQSIDLDAIFKAADEVDECWLMVGTPKKPRDVYDGYVYFIWANGDDGWTCISDYTTNLESVLAPVNALIETAMTLSDPGHSAAWRKLAEA